MLVNTSSLGMSNQPPLEIGLDDLPGDALVTDIVYNPLETDLLARARLRGNPVVDGLELHRLWTDPKQGGKIEGAARDARTRPAVAARGV